MYFGAMLGMHGLWWIFWLVVGIVLPLLVKHDEAGPADALRQRIECALGWSATVPRLGQTVEIPS